MTHGVRPTVVAIGAKPILRVVLVLGFFTWFAAAEIYWTDLQVPHHGEAAAAALVGVDVVHCWMLVFFVLALLQDLEELRMPQLRPLRSAAFTALLVLVLVAPCALVWLLGGAAWDVLFMATGSVAGTAGALLWRSGFRTRQAPGPWPHAGMASARPPAPRPRPWRAVRVALGPPYAPASWKRRVIELAVVCAVLAGPPLLVILFAGSLSPRGFPILLHLAEFMSFVIAMVLCWIWPLMGVVALVTSPSGALTELALLPGQGSGRRQLRRLCLVALSLPAGALIVLLLLALGVVAHEQLPHAVSVKVALEFLMIPLLTLPPLANRLTKPPAPNAWGGALVMFSQIWTWLLIFWSASPQNWHGFPRVFLWVAIAVIAAGLMFLVGMTAYALRKLSQRPHPYLEASA
jgi:hypothetical protein